MNESLNNCHKVRFKVFKNASYIKADNLKNGTARIFFELVNFAKKLVDGTLTYPFTGIYSSEMDGLIFLKIIKSFWTHLKLSIYVDVHI